MAHLHPELADARVRRRGLDVLSAMFQWLDRAPLGRNEHTLWWRRHDAYDGGG